MRSWCCRRGRFWSGVHAILTSSLATQTLSVPQCWSLLYTVCCKLEVIGSAEQKGRGCTTTGVRGCRYVGLDWETEVVWSWGLPQRSSSTTVSPIRRGHSQHRGLCTGIQELCLLLDTEGRTHGERVVPHGWLPGMTNMPQTPSPSDPCLMTHC